MVLYRAFATVGAMTIVSRVLGFVRDMLIAAVLGAGPVADAFFVAFRVPNLFRRLFAEGAFNAAFIPLFAKRLHGEGGELLRLCRAGSCRPHLRPRRLHDPRRDRHALAHAALRARLPADPAKLDRAVLLRASCCPICCACRWWRFMRVLDALGHFTVASFAPMPAQRRADRGAYLALMLPRSGRPDRGQTASGSCRDFGRAAQLLVVWAAVPGRLRLRNSLPRARSSDARAAGSGRIPPSSTGGMAQLNCCAQHRHRLGAVGWCLPLLC